MCELFNAINLVGFILFAFIGLFNTAANIGKGEIEYEFAKKVLFAFTVLLYLEAMVSCMAFLAH